MIEVALKLQRPGFTLDVDLKLPARGVTGLFGPSGCGKTTVLRAVAGLERALGHVRLSGAVWQDDPAGAGFVPAHRRALGYVIQEAALFPHLSVQGNIAYGRKRVAAGASDEALHQIVELLGIGHLLQRRPALLSGGERQRVAIARALATNPRLLLMDEPLAALDAARKAEILPYLERLNETLAIPIVYVSHAIDEVARLADHLVLLRGGRVLAEGPVAEMLARLDLPLPLGEEAGVVLQGVVGARDPQWHLARLDVGAGAGVGASGDAPACSLWARDQGFALGRKVRLRVLARDVSLTRTPQTGTSIGNQLRGTVEALSPGEHPALALVRVRVGDAALVARLTQRSAHELALAPGQVVWAQVKTVALME